MELVFIRHAQGEHTLNWPNQLHMQHPALTESGNQQAEQLRHLYPLVSGDVVVTSPARRTIETVNIWSKDISVQKYVTPLLGPRMFPQNPEWVPLGCDKIYTYDEVSILFPEFTAVQSEQTLWDEGINTMSTAYFEFQADKFLKWISRFKGNVYCATHDGTINSYRLFLGESGITRGDFLRETGAFRIRV
ncbi:histidine phosphatase family protein [Paenibacillus urinalis]|uniref:Histidine phosphatase family protein n=1 Tax=Paenibacillus urinalis TaxID=521520 RepID=A0ABY7XGQ0_9BACL|nr:histidine phosphatase family protein [Paenibacillus urinalis]WDH95520.1 histidine phosphatase family protein [Paenibacillus urinalis]WDI03717.1 histidine phosphatase family protein [Paenibacillus urinalis]